MKKFNFKDFLKEERKLDKVIRFLPPGKKDFTKAIEDYKKTIKVDKIKIS